MIKKLRVTVEGKAYEVEVEVLDDSGAPSVALPAPALAPTPAPVASAPAPSTPSTPSAPPTSEPGDITSPLAGRVVSVDVQPGQSVKEGEQLLTLEAMKMNTFIFSDRDGKIASIHIKVGDAVEEGRPLLSYS
jgi:glutaconyl-CoA/methylmalonyl-CoA decarboxylase subunit gamma